MHNQADIAADPHRPKILVLGAVKLVKTMPRIRRIQLQIEGSGLRQLLLLAAEFGEAVGEGVGDEELHSTEETTGL